MTESMIVPFAQTICSGLLIGNAVLTLFRQLNPSTQIISTEIITCSNAFTYFFFVGYVFNHGVSLVPPSNASLVKPPMSIVPKPFVP